MVIYMIYNKEHIELLLNYKESCQISFISSTVALILIIILYYGFDNTTMAWILVVLYILSSIFVSSQNKDIDEAIEKELGIN